MTRQGIAVGLVVAAAGSLFAEAVADEQSQAKVGFHFVHTEHIGAEHLRNLDLPSSTEGLFVMGVIPGSPAEEAGIGALDLILEIDGQELESDAVAQEILAALEPDERVAIELRKPTNLEGRRIRWQRDVVPVTPMTADDFYSQVARIERDEIEQTRHYYHPEAPESVASGTALVPYVVQRGNGETELRLRVQFRSSDWLFLRRLTILAGGERHRVGLGRVSGDNSGGAVWEWSHLPVSDDLREALERMIEDRDAVWRLDGRDYHRDIVVEDDLRAQIAFALGLFDHLESSPQGLARQKD